ncbi:hypothetical protein [Nocardioides sp. GY 10127]|uniref:hypothetical protein n=1 Tax=Nocardioides sp. GY 10127 TaxID=2569762 RepID=UPI0010A7EDEB|nr:hypothetical protein [Nocardioides sp. GY 10127]TIC79442.1 hypothetical protein E8D37_17885 [Nocardioides sp. GY 10127]
MVLTAAMIAQAFREVELPTSTIIVQPPGGETLVNIATLVRTEAEPFTRTVTLLGRSITLDISPDSYTWHFGDGTTLSTTEPGQPYDSALPATAYVSHEYASAQKASVSVDTTWSARWREGTGDWQPVDGTVTTTGPAQTLTVRTATPRLTAAGFSYD